MLSEACGHNIILTLLVMLWKVKFYKQYVNVAKKEDVFCKHSVMYTRTILTFDLLIMTVKPLQPAWNRTRRRVHVPSCLPLSKV